MFLTGRPWPDVISATPGQRRMKVVKYSECWRSVRRPVEHIGVGQIAIRVAIVMAEPGHRDRAHAFVSPESRTRVRPDPRDGGDSPLTKICRRLPGPPTGPGQIPSAASYLPTLNGGVPAKAGKRIAKLLNWFSHGRDSRPPRFKRCLRVRGWEAALEASSLK